MNIIILAAGIGSRLYPHTENTPKCLLPLTDNETILDRMLNSLKDIFPQTNIIIVSGFEAAKIQEHISKDINIIFNPFFRVTNSIASLWLARNYLQKDTMIINSDVIVSKEVLAIISDSHIAPFVVLDSSRQCTDADYKVKTQEQHVLSMGKNLSLTDFTGEYAGITYLDSKSAMHLTKKIEQMLMEENYTTWYETALVNLVKEDEFDLFYVDIAGQKWFEVDTPQDLKAARALIN